MLASIRLFQFAAQRLPQCLVHHDEVFVRGRRRQVGLAVPLEGGEPVELLAHGAAIGLLDLTFVDDHGLG